ncbi:MAG: VOC family protein [Bacteroidota bacterium]
MDASLIRRTGRVLSADIAVPELDRLRSFYSRILGTGERPLWRDDLNNRCGVPVIGLGPRTPELELLPLQWLPHIQVADVFESAQRAVDLGGKELLRGGATDGASPWAVLEDPNGAAFGVIPDVSDTVGDSDDVRTRVEEAGRIAWLDLTVSEATTTSEFYRDVVGWEAQPVAMENEGQRYADYNMVGADGEAVAGVCHARGVNAGLPEVWLLYLPVGDLAESLRRVREKGGAVVSETRSADGAIAFATIRDPVGAYVALAQASPPGAQ